MHNKTLLALALAALPAAAFAAEEPTLPAIVVSGTRIADGASNSLGSSDATALLANKPGVSVYAAGGVSSLPALRGLADDRIKILIDGAESTAACGNHMNAPLSYIDPTQVSSTQVIAGLSPVSAGGDNIAGVIAVSSTQPAFAKPGELLSSGSLALQSRSVDHGRTASISGTIATEQVSFSYSGATTRADSYQDGKGNKVLDTLFKSTNQSVSLAAKGDDQLLVLKAGEQHIPYQGFANQYMDMTRNHSVFANVGYEGSYGWGKLSGKVYWQDTQHEMGFFSPEREGTMPMNTHGKDTGYTLEAAFAMQDGQLKLGNELHRFHLDDWWPPVVGSMMMAPNTYWNVNNGQRDRTALYAEWEGRLSAQWSATVGVRNEWVKTNAGPVQDYGCGMMCMKDGAAAAAFNASDRSHRDSNLDLTVLTRYEADANASYEFGFAQKTRSPNLYERYTWGRGTMAMTMIGWFGDANGYVGDTRLKPEVARTLSATADWHDADRSSWAVQLSPFYTAVQDYIDVDRIGDFNPYMDMGETRALLRFANHNAHLYGINLAWQVAAWNSASWGKATLKGKLDWTRGKRNDGGDLYHIMPPNLTLGLEQAVGAWTHEAELQWVAKKDRVDERRYEDRTASYGLVNLRTRYQLPHGITLQAGVRNLFDRQYSLPLGGVNLAAFQAGESTQLQPLVGQGRSLDLGLNIKF